MKITVICLLLCSVPAAAAPIDWWDITAGTGIGTPSGFATGVIPTGSGNVTVEYTGPLQAINTGTGGNLWFDQGGFEHYTGNAAIDNLPPANDRLRFSHAGAGALTFSQPVVDPVMLFRSLGNFFEPVTYTFDTPFVLLSYSGGAGDPGHDKFEINGNSLTGRELHGALLFPGTFTSIAWDLGQPEFFQEVIFGVTGVVPLPPAVVLLGSALVALVARRRAPASSV